MPKLERNATLVLSVEDIFSALRITGYPVPTKPVIRVRFATDSGPHEKVIDDCDAIHISWGESQDPYEPTPI